MSKAIFRWLRGEINGYYLTNIHNTLNSVSEEMKSFLVHFRNMQFDLDTMDDETIYNLGKFASIFTPRRPRSESRSSIYLTESNVVDSTDFSERGLYSMSDENFNFYHTDLSIDTPDINTLSSEEERSSLVGDEDIVGYISSEETNVIDDDGYVRSDKVLSEAPSSVAYSDFYGNNFLFLSEGEVVYESISASLFYKLFKVMQWIRYNGASLKSLVQVISILCPDGLVTITDLVVASSGRFVYVYYNYDSEVDLTSKEQRLSLLEYIVDLKFKQVVLVQNG